LANTADLQSAIDKALTQVRRAIESGMKASDGSPAQVHLEKLERELNAQRARVVQRSSVDREWLQATVRWVVEWVPDEELTLVAALGAIARAAPTALS
jgi:hypothetical protein